MKDNVKTHEYYIQFKDQYFYPIYRLSIIEKGPHIFVLKNNIFKSELLKLLLDKHTIWKNTLMLLIIFVYANAFSDGFHLL